MDWNSPYEDMGTRKRISQELNGKKEWLLTFLTTVDDRMILYSVQAVCADAHTTNSNIHGLNYTYT